MLSVALTGNVAAGKSRVAERWRESGVPVNSADDLARQAVVPGAVGLRAVTEEFGPDVLTADGTLDRGRLREVVFADVSARHRLEQILHPIIATLREGWLEARRREGVALAVSEIPLLFETESEGDFDVVVLVDAPVEVRLERIVQRRGVDEIQARRIIESQLDPTLKRGRSDFVVENTGSLEELNVSADSVLAELRARAGVGS